MASCYFWADYASNFLQKNGTLDAPSVTLVKTETKKMIDAKYVIIPNHILDPLFCFMRYTLICALHLNKLGKEAPGDGSLVPNNQVINNKRKRIVDKLANGYTVAKKTSLSVQ